MITKQEIMDFSKEFNLRPDIIEKDYVLGWLLAGIASHPELQNTWVFKGGTCLKKCYFETFRFSEDLDFTLIEESHADERFLFDCFQKISIWIFENSGIEIPINKIRFEKYSNIAGKISIEGRIGYIGPLQRRSDSPRIKIDLTSDEVLVLSPLLRYIHHPYSDNQQIKVKTTCYGFYELFAEKIRALRERARPRDLYDVIHLYRHIQAKIDHVSVLNVLREKCKFKKIEVPTSESIINHPKQQELAAEWGNMLSHQLPTLPPLESFLKDLPTLFVWLDGNSLKELNPFPILDGNIDNLWLPPSMIQPWYVKIPLELIRYAGANHLCIDLNYQGEKKLIEPYSLNRTHEKNLLLLAVDHESGIFGTYLIDKIKKITVTPIPFLPKVKITLTPVSDQLLF